MLTVKTDNANLAAKLRLREYFLDRYHAGREIFVLDCCEGCGVLWGQLARGRNCRRFGLDVKRSPGRLRMDSRRFLLAGKVAYDVVDIDTYGSPWGHWVNLLPRIERSMTVFLTYGFVGIGGGRVDNVVQSAMGWSFRALEAPSSLLTQFSPIIPERMIGLAFSYGLRVVEVVEAISNSPKVRYFGVRLDASPHATPADEVTGTAG